MFDPNNSARRADMTDVLGWLRRWGKEADHAEKAALAARLRRELVDYEARLEQAVDILQAAKTELRDAGLALAGREMAGNGHPGGPFPGAECSNLEFSNPRHLEAARKRLASATTTRELAWLGFQVARSRVSLHSGVIRRLEQELAEAEPLSGLKGSARTSTET